MKLLTNEEILRASERRFRSLIENSSDAIALFNLEGEMLYASPSTPQVLGYTPEEFLRLKALEIIHPDDRELVKEQLRTALKQPRVGVSGQARVLCKDGSWRYMEGTLTNLLDEPSVGAIVNNYRDITERKLAEAALEEAGQRAFVEYEQLTERIALLAQSLGTARSLITVFRALRDFALASTPCNGIFISLYDADKRVRKAVYAGYEDGVEEDVSHLPPMPMTKSPNSLAVLTGEVIITNDFQQAVKGQPVVNIGTERDPLLPQSSLVVPMSVMGQVVGAVEAQSKEAAAFNRSHATAMQMAANLAANAIKNVQLLEREREKEEHLRQAQKMEAVGKLAGGVAHDFNNLLTAINGYSDILLRNLDEDNPIRYKIEEIRNAGERAAGLTRQLLAFSRKQVLQPVVLDLNATVNNVGKMLQRLIGENIELLLSLKPALGQVKVDPGQIEQVIMNLAVNARDAMPEGGKLIIETANVELNEEYVSEHVVAQVGSYVMLAVTDNGHGMDAETQKRIFEPFFTTKEVGKGTGLGLSTVYGIVKQSGGNIWVYSEPGKGTTFKIYLPRINYEKKREEREERAEPALAKGSETILLVEDEPVVRSIARATLEMNGYKVIEAANGREALSVSHPHEETIDLVLTDVVMPVMGGKQLTEQLSHFRPRMKVLYMSGYSDDALLHHGVLDEGIAFLEKPFTPDALARKVREVLDQAVA